MQPQHRNAVLFCLTASLAACANAAPVAEVKGGCFDANAAQVCTYAQVQGDHVFETGAIIPIASIENAKLGEASMDWPPKPLLVSSLPENASTQSGLTELTMYWESAGHPPKPYMVPHFDFHFYLVPDAEVKAIDCKDEAKPADLPVGYSLPDQPLPPDMAKMLGTDKLVGVCVPQMGMHALPTNELSSNDAFNGTMVIGYYHAKPIFIEPMVSRDFLLRKASFTLKIPVIPGLKGRYPTMFHADYDAAAQQYRFRFTNFLAV